MDYPIFVVKFVRNDLQADEEYFYYSEQEARYHLDLFADDTSGLYQRIELIALDPTEKIIGGISFG